MALPEAATIIGIPADSITAVGTAIQAITTIALAIFALKQLSALIEQLKLAREVDARADSRRIDNNGVRAYERYYSDPVISEATRRIWVASKDGTDYSAVAIDSHYLIITLNYLDGIAVGIKQHVYSAPIVKEHMQSTFIKIIDVIQAAVLARIIRIAPATRR